jgi:hypothetical protein
MNLNLRDSGIFLAGAVLTFAGLYLVAKLQPSKPQDPPPIAQQQSSKCVVEAKSAKGLRVYAESSQSQAVNLPDIKPELKNSLILLPDQLSYSRRFAEMELFGKKFEFEGLGQYRKPDNSIHAGILIKF